jgi:hypothetical protein
MSGWRLGRLIALYRDFYEIPFRRQRALEERRRDDLFRLLILSESLGLPNPAAWYCLELMPFMLEDFHRWHRRMGMEHSPLDSFRCC